MSEKLKLLLVADTYHPKVDGTLRFMDEFVKRSSEAFDLSLLIPKFTAAQPSNVTGIKTCQKISLSGYPLMKLSFSNLRLIKNAIQKTEIVFIQGPALISYLSMYYGHKYHKLTVFYTHTIAWELFEKFAPPVFNKLMNRIIRWFSVFLYNRCNLILVPYPGLQQYLQKIGVSSSTRVARLGVDIVQFSPAADKNHYRQKLGLPKDKTIIGYVGRISKEKNIETLLEAFQKLKPQEKVHLLLVGDGPKVLTEKFKQQKNCTVTGFKSNVYDYLKAMDLFVMPSLTETTSLATLEAMATGLPVIVSKVGFLKDYVQRDYNGLFFPKNSPRILANKIIKLLQNQELRERLGRNARKTVSYSFSWERSINRIKRLIVSYYADKSEYSDESKYVGK